ncbi:MAG: hypothetical protein Q9184_003945 [Pyrenodesmia sp. 2 TL-2023]
MENHQRPLLTIYRSPHFSYCFYTTFALTYTDKLENEQLVWRFTCNHNILYKFSSALHSSRANPKTSNHHAKSIELWQHHLAALCQKTDALYKEHHDMAREIWNSLIARNYIPPFQFDFPGLGLDDDED